MTGWLFRVGDRIEAKYDTRVKAVVIACMPLGEYAVRYESDGAIERGCREHLMRKIK